MTLVRHEGVEVLTLIRPTGPSVSMKICLAGEGAQGFSHYEALQAVEGVEIVSLAGGIAADAEVRALSSAHVHAARTACTRETTHGGEWGLRGQARGRGGGAGRVHVHVYRAGPQFARPVAPSHTYVPQRFAQKTHLQFVFVTTLRGCPWNPHRNSRRTGAFRTGRWIWLSVWPGRGWRRLC